MASLGDRVDKSMFGTQEADAIFRGREIHKLGPKKYKIVDGAFTTCVQPTPRWQVVSGDATISLDDYALLKNSVFRVKGVPLMYLPIFYYPIQEDDRATGFLIPTYGTSTYRGQFVEQRLLLGHLAQPGRDDRARLVLQGRPAGGRRVPLHRERRVAGQRTRLVPRREVDRRHHRRDDGGHGAAIRSPAR